MSQGAFNLNLRGRWGNTCFQICFAIAYCKKHNLELRIESDWIGEKIFDLKLGRFKERFLDRQRTESTLDPSGEGDVEFTGYCQNQQSLIYTRTQAREWFRLSPTIEKYRMYNFSIAKCPVIHLRRGDYPGSGYPTIGYSAYMNAMREFEEDDPDYPLHRVVSDDFPADCAALPKELSFVHDWLMLYTARTLYRANSSFSYWASVLGHSERSYSPIIQGLEGGKEHNHIKFTPGNWPRLANHEFTTDLWLT